MLIDRTNVLVSGELCDVHARLERMNRFALPLSRPIHEVAHCGVYVRPNGPVNGYWYFPAPTEARQILTSLGVQS
jgi:hypothetical protein